MLGGPAACPAVPVITLQTARCPLSSTCTSRGSWVWVADGLSGFCFTCQAKTHDEVVHLHTLQCSYLHHRENINLTSRLWAWDEIKRICHLTKHLADADLNEMHRQKQPRMKPLQQLRRHQGKISAEAHSVSMLFPWGSFALHICKKPNRHSLHICRTPNRHSLHICKTPNRHSGTCLPCREQKTQLILWWVGNGDPALPANKNLHVLKHFRSTVRDPSSEPSTPSCILQITQHTAQHKHYANGATLHC